MRRFTKQLNYGGVLIGGGAPVAVQSMTNTKTSDTAATLEQIKSLAALGCELVRVAVPDMQAAFSLKAICAASLLPVVADIHFDASLAVKAAESGIAGLRINPGNLEGADNLKKVVAAARAHKLPIRVGANSGSLPKDLADKPLNIALVEAALRQVQILESLDFTNIKVSLKSSNVLETISAYRNFSRLSDYPLHLGITEAGGILAGAIKSGVGIGALLLDGLGDTIRVSLSAPPEEEVKAAWVLLRACGLRKRGVEIISCPTCGRTGIDLLNMLEEIEKQLSAISSPLTVAVMGCVVNGPGEAAHADLGIAGGSGKGVLFAKGKVIAALPEDKLVPALLREVEKLAAKN
jgi:(E)-4-hydroxy-3-methylbut-2-enyl-diphosphate synthase